MATKILKPRGVNPLFDTKNKAFSTPCPLYPKKHARVEKEQKKEEEEVSEREK